MKNKKLMKAIFILCFITAGFLLMKFYVHDSEPEKIKVANKVNETAAKNFYKKNKLRCTDAGCSIISNIEEMRLALRSKESFDISKGRKMIVECIDEYLNNINSDEKIRPYLQIFPFNETNIELSISHIISSQSPSKLQKVTIRKGDIKYDIASDDENIISCEETFQEAKSELNKEHVAVIEEENSSNAQEKSIE